MLTAAIDFRKIAEQSIAPFKDSIFAGFTFKHGGDDTNVQTITQAEAEALLSKAYSDYRCGAGFVEAYTPLIAVVQSTLASEDEVLATLVLDDAGQTLIDALVNIINNAYLNDDTFEQAFKKVADIIGFQSAYVVFDQFVDTRIVRHWCEAL